MPTRILSSVIHGGFIYCLIKHIQAYFYTIMMFSLVLLLVLILMLILQVLLQHSGIV